MSRTSFLSNHTCFINKIFTKPSPLDFVLLTFILFTLTPLSAAEKPTTVPAKDPIVVASKHYQVVFENELIRVLKAHYGPDESSALHGHPRNLVILLNDGQSQSVDSEGNIVKYKFKAGDVIFREALEHAGTNSSNQDLHFIAVEFKDPKCQ